MYYLTEFNGVDLPQYNPFTQAGTRPLIAPIATMADGRGFDRLGNLQAQQGAGTVSYVGSFYNSQGHVVESSYYGMLAQVGKVGWLVRRREPTGTHERIYARLLGVDYVHTPEYSGRLAQGVRLTFYISDPTWHGMQYGLYLPAYGAFAPVGDHLPGLVNNTYVTVTGTAGQTSVTATLRNLGNAPVRAFMIQAFVNTTTLTGGFYIDADFSSVAGLGYYFWQVTGNLTTSSGYVIDTLAKTVGTGLPGFASTSRIDDFAYVSSHTSEDWLAIPAGGDFTMTIGPNSGTFPSGNAVFRFYYAEAWQ